MLGLGPYITATIIMQLLTMIFPALKTLYYEEGAAGRAAESVGFRPKDAKEALNEYLSPAQQAANKRVSDAKGFIDRSKP